MGSIRATIGYCRAGMILPGRKLMGLIEAYVNIKNYKDYDIEAYHLEKLEAAEVVQALEKQIPKKVRIEAAGTKTISGYCPSCEKDLVYIIQGDRPTFKSHCPVCGQKLDWKEGIVKDS